MEKLKVGFFGGCFNPPSNIHINLANNLIKEKIVDKVIFVPVGDYYNKPDLISSKHRYNMLKLACERFDNLLVEDIALNYNKKLYASDTFKLIYNKYNKECDIYFIMGSDNFEKMPLWKDYEELIKNYKFIVIERPNHRITQKLNNTIYFENNQTEDMSSTNIRNKIKNKEDITQYIDEKVLKYIKENDIYIT